MIADMKATKIILDGCATFAAKCHDDMLDALKYGVMNSSTYSWSKWSSTKNDKTASGRLCTKRLGTPCARTTARRSRRRWLGSIPRT